MKYKVSRPVFIPPRLSPSTRSVPALASAWRGQLYLAEAVLHRLARRAISDLVVAALRRNPW